MSATTSSSDSEHEPFPPIALDSLGVVDLYFDGGCKNNPIGEASCGAVVKDGTGRTLRHVGRALGIGSNNVAEWSGLLHGLRAAHGLGATGVRAFGDSKLVCEQFSGNFSIRVDSLRIIADKVRTLVSDFPDGVTATWIPREANRAADAICSGVLEGTYRGDPEDMDAAMNSYAANAEVEVTFVCTIRMDAKAAREAIESGVPADALRRRMAREAESRLLLAGRVGGYTVTPTRIKG